MLDLILLGTGGGMPIPERSLSAVLLNYKGHKVLVDCGEGTQVSMKICRTGFKTVDVICISHWHGDHIVGLPGILATIGNSGRTEPLTIIGPVGIKNIVKGLTVIVPYLPYELNIIEVGKDSIAFNYNKNNLFIEKTGDFVINTMEVDHSSPCVAYSFNVKRRAKFDLEKAIENQVPKNIWNVLQKGERVECEGKIYEPFMVLGEEREGLKFSFVTDTVPLKELIPFIYKSDLLICEGTYGSDLDLEKAIKNKHMTFSQAALLAKEGQVNELILTHFSTAMENPEEFLHCAKNIFPNTKIGKDRMAMTLKFK